MWEITGVPTSFLLQEEVVPPVLPGETKPDQVVSKKHSKIVKQDPESYLGRLSQEESWNIIGATKDKYSSDIIEKSVQNSSLQEEVTHHAAQKNVRGNPSLSSRDVPDNPSLLSRDVPVWVYMTVSVKERVLKSETHLMCGCLTETLLGPGDETEPSCPDELHLFKLKKIVRMWDDIDECGTALDYRCPKCQRCTDCAQSGQLCNRSTREEEEQFVIEQSIFMDYENRRVTVKLPFIKDPQELSLEWGIRDNFRMARSVF
jgi:hypothetical protein